MSFVIAEVSRRQLQLEELRRLFYSYQTACQGSTQATQQARQTMLVDSRLSTHSSFPDGVNSQSVTTGRVKSCEEKSAEALRVYRQAMKVFVNDGGSIQTLAQTLYPGNGYQRYLFVKEHSNAS